MNKLEHELEKNRWVQIATRDLKELGYPSLTEKEVRDQLDKVLAGSEDLGVIGLMILNPNLSLKERRKSK